MSDRTENIQDPDDSGIIIVGAQVRYPTPLWVPLLWVAVVGLVVAFGYWHGPGVLLHINWLCCH
jgi:hypothetical protein